ncbi:hypothetical protein CNMCM8714_007639 [Aspergillus fumigatus]|nr:hypothetical protein CNMCM8714_007639 [Aspergillus fumigatus]
MAERPRPTVLRRVLTAIIDPVDREEQGYHQYPTMRGLHDPENEGLSMGSANNPQLARRLTVATTHASTLIPPSDKLLVFRALTGIDTVPALAIPHHHPRSAPNVGIYTRVVRAEQAAAQQFRFFSILMNTCLGIQIVVAAALTALGAARGPHNAVTAFGAINTIMAGILTYLKGSGLPDRLKHYQNEWRNIREYIEQREREFCLDGCQLDVQAEVVFIESMYEGVKREIKATKSGENRSSAGPGQMPRSFLPQARAPELQKQPGKPVAGSPVSVPEPVLEKNQPYERHHHNKAVLKITDSEDGSIVAFAVWQLPVPSSPEDVHLKHSHSPSHSHAHAQAGDEHPYPVSSDRELCEVFFGGMEEMKKRIMGSRPHYYLEMLGTRPEYAGQGLASKLLRWGLERADEVGLETYLSASPAGRPLYEKFGFRVVEEREVVAGYVQGYMLRAGRVAN